jgi:hypothetical protein
VAQTLPEPSQSAKLAWLEQHVVSHPKRWLELAAGRVDKALLMAQDPLWMPLLKLMPYLLHGTQTDAMGLAQDMSKAELRRVVEVMSLWMCDVLSIANGASARFFAAQNASLLTLVQRMDLEAASEFAQQLNQLARVAEHPLNARTQCEALLLEYKTLFH